MDADTYTEPDHDPHFKTHNFRVAIDFSIVTPRDLDCLDWDVIRDNLLHKIKEMDECELYDTIRSIREEL